MELFNNLPGQEERPANTKWSIRLWWQRHCARENIKDIEREKVFREWEKAEREEAAAIAEENRIMSAGLAMHELEQNALPAQALEAARLTISRSSTSMGNGQKLSAVYSQRLVNAILLFEEELKRGKATIDGKEVSVYADIPAAADNEGGGAGEDKEAL